MQNHTKIYLNHFGYDTSDFIPCEVCNTMAVDIHHINARGMGGDPKGARNKIENLQALCRNCHLKYGDSKEYLEMLKEKHQIKLDRFV